MITYTIFANEQEVSSHTTREEAHAALMALKEQDSSKEYGIAVDNPNPPIVEQGPQPQTNGTTTI